MRFAVLAAAVAALWVQPAQAAVVWTISGTVVGTTTDRLPCSTGICDVVRPLSRDVSFSVSEQPHFDRQGAWLENGVYNFFHGANANDYIYSGTFRSLGFGQFEGLTLRLDRFNATCVFSGTNCIEAASTTNFSVRQTFPAPVPEPTTWALMLLGFGAIGAMMRHHVARSRCLLTLKLQPLPPCE